MYHRSTAVAQWMGLYIALALVIPTGVPTGVFAADGQLRIKHVCRLKGQEINTLSGIGLVVGLNGTGDDKMAATTQAFVQMLHNFGAAVPLDSSGLPDVRAIQDTGNVALVEVSATVPAAGVMQGEQLDCTVSAVSAKSLKGGRLVYGYLLGPRADVPVIYAIASGQLSLPDPTMPTAAVVYRGCKMETTITNQFIDEDTLTLVLDPNLASFTTAVDITHAINSDSRINASLNSTDVQAVATAIDQMHVVVKVPAKYRQQRQTVEFVSLILESPLPQLTTQDRVVINEREGIVIIGENIRISPVAINHKNLSIEARAGGGQFVGVDIEAPEQARPRLKNLVEALNALNVPTADVIAIIRTLKSNGSLYGELVIQ